MTVIGGIVMGNYFSYMRISTKEERGKQTLQENLSLTDLNGIGWRKLFSLVILLCSKTLRDLHVRPKMDMRSIWN